MKRLLSNILLTLICLFLAASCGTVRGTWKSTKKLFYNYLDTDPSINLAYEGTSNPGLLRLAQAVAPLDEKVQRMLRQLETQDTKPEKVWVDEFLGNYPWLNGVTVLSDSGTVLYNAPPLMLKRLDFEPLINREQRYLKRWMAGQLVADESSAELVVAQPFYTELTRDGIIAVNFDVATLAKLSPSADDFIIFSPEGGILWNGNNVAAAAGISSLPWKNILKGAVYGEVSSGGSKYYWMVRYLGDLPIIYAVDAKPLPPKPKADAKAAQPKASGDSGAAQEAPAEAQTPAK